MRSDLWNRAIDVWYRATGRDGDFRCPECGYELRGLPAPSGFFRCPECGTATERHKAISPREPITWWQRWRLPANIAVFLAAVILSVCVHPLFMLAVVALAAAAPLADSGLCGYGHRRRALDFEEIDREIKKLPLRSPRPASTAADDALSAALLEAAPGRTADSSDQAAEK